MAIAGALAAGGGVGFVAVVAWLHARRPDVNPATDGVSHYAIGPTRVVATAAFLSLAVGLAATALALAAVVPPVRSSAIVSFWIAALGIAIVAAVPMEDPALAARRWLIHSLGAFFFFAATAAGAVGASLDLGQQPGLALARLLVLLTVLFFLSMSGVPSFARARGWLQRACFLVTVAWIICLAYNSVIQS